MLRPTDRLPAFSGEMLMPSGAIEMFELAQQRGRWLTLFFWPLDLTFVCPTEIKAYSELAGEFIVDPNGVIQSAVVNSLNVGCSAKETLRTLDALRSGGLTACEWQRGDRLIQAA